MKMYLIFLFVIFSFYSAVSQSITVFNIDTSNFPIIKAKFYAFDSYGKQILNLSLSDFEIKENNKPLKVLSVSCPTPTPPVPISSVLVMDVSGSMCGTGLDIAKAAANSWVNILPSDEFECAITSFSDFNYLNQDFTKDKTKLTDAINNLFCMDGTDYNSALLNPAAGGLLIAKTGKYKRVIVFLSDGGPNFTPYTYQIINQAKENNITIYCVTINMPAPQCMKDFANQTGGLFFENIKSKEEAEECYIKIQKAAQSDNPCSIEWQSEVTCNTDIKNGEVRLIPNTTITYFSYNSPFNSEAKLEFNPSAVNFLNALPGIKKSAIITVTARNSSYNVTNISSSNPAYEITPTSFSLTAGQSTYLSLSYIPADSGYTYCSFDFANESCETKYYASGGFPGKKPKRKTLKLIHPNGGQVFVVGKDTLITWAGVLPDETVKLEYSTNNGLSWLPISDNATGLKYKWRVPKTPGNQCLARVTSKAVEIPYQCNNGYVQICKQLWMGCNLDVSTYRNGDIIPEIQDSSNWVNAIKGAWCYYNNDPETGSIYGKIYNWYAVNDPRGLAPNGWHIPSDAEWSEMENCLGGSNIAGGHLKEANLKHWLSPNIDANDSSGFTALPGGCRFDYGTFYNMGYYGSWWTSDSDNISNSWNRQLNYSNSKINRYSNNKRFGFSVRCIKD